MSELKIERILVNGNLSHFVTTLRNETTIVSPATSPSRLSYDPHLELEDIGPGRSLASTTST
ncbi:hypothetical protein Tdes44962_MAKER02938 [Teratosphaeria destructans]|uniref:Uncharacterized protein n=1 Tax=Teratosphaeria destructans TaxID=418781 RepID=A0A9W7SRL1_9PEZI|nr:hypothetical protein Tdes44962_MAKER02938 [Teratosphaeria destructans]